VGGASGTDWTLHVVHSTTRGQTWSADVRTITNAKNPALAVNSSGQVGLLYQEYTGTNWNTNLELTTNAWATAATTVALHTASAATPTATFQPYLGDYVRLLAVGTDFYGVFCGNNTPNPANFPSGVTYQRNANWNTHILLSTDNATPVAVSIDPFFFHYSETPVIRVPTPITRAPSPIRREPVITPEPVSPRPVTSEPIRPEPAAPEPGPPAQADPGAAGGGDPGAGDPNVEL
jgi:hypothetical protein